MLKEDGFVWNIWSDPPFPIYTDFYIFNCTNAEAVLKNGSKPIVQELGPYSYRSVFYKLTVILNFLNCISINMLFFVKGIPFEKHECGEQH